LTQPLLKKLENGDQNTAEVLARYFYKTAPAAFQTAKSSLNLHAIQIRQPLLARIYQLSFDRDDAMQVYVPPQTN
jgi:hypothetical protein